MFWFFAIAMLIVGGLVVITLLILNRHEIQQACTRYIEEKNLDAAKAKIMKKYREGDYHVVHVDLLNNYSNKTGEIVLKGKEDANDYYLGEMIPI